MSTVKSPQQILGSFVKLRLRKLRTLQRDLPKFFTFLSWLVLQEVEAPRLDFFHNETEFEEDGWGKNGNVHEVDLVLTSRLIHVFSKSPSPSPSSKFKDLEQSSQLLFRRKDSFLW